MARKAASKTTPKIQRLPISRARTNLGAVIKRVQIDNEYVVLQQDGVSVAAIMNIDKFEDYLELQDPKVRTDIAQSRKEVEAGKSRPIEEFLKELDQQAERRHKRRRLA